MKITIDLTKEQAEFLEKFLVLSQPFQESFIALKDVHGKSIFKGMDRGGFHKISCDIWARVNAGIEAKGDKNDDND